MLLQSGLDNEWWADSMECYCFSAKHSRYLVSWEYTLRKAVRNAFDGPVVPFGAMVEYHPISAKDQSGLHQFGSKVLPGVFLGYALYAAGIWKGDIEELEEMDASELHARRHNAKEV